MVESLRPTDGRNCFWAGSTPVLEGQLAHELLDCRSENHADGVEECPVEKVIRGGNVEAAARMRILCRDESVKEIEYRCVPYPTARGLGAVLAFHDLTRQNELEKDLRRLASIAEESPIAIVEINEDGNLIHANPAMMSLVERVRIPRRRAPRDIAF